MPNREPKLLARGKAFHRLTKRRGRVDIFVDDDSDVNHVAIAKHIIIERDNYRHITKKYIRNFK
jgi:hypothetical protein